jgi:hypothetical protein
MWFRFGNNGTNSILSGTQFFLYHKTRLTNHVCNCITPPFLICYVLSSISIFLNRKKLNFLWNWPFSLTHCNIFVLYSQKLRVYLFEKYVIFPSWKVIRLTRIVFYLLYQHDRFWSIVCTQGPAVLLHDCCLLVAQGNFSRFGRTESIKLTTGFNRTQKILRLNYSIPDCFENKESRIAMGRLLRYGTRLFLNVIFSKAFQFLETMQLVQCPACPVCLFCICIKFDLSF